MGPKTREWGFYTERPLTPTEKLMGQIELDMFAPGQKMAETKEHWIHWKDYYTAQRAEKVKKD
jgi:hypothetical protein